MHSQTICETIDALFILNMFFECLIIDAQLICVLTNTKYVSELELKYILFTNALLYTYRTIKLNCCYIIFTLYSEYAVILLAQYFIG